jgi:hypothetical protein
VRRDHLLAVAAIAAVGLALAGCGEDPGIEEGSVHFQGTKTEALDPLVNDMKKKMRENSYLKNSAEDGKSAATSNLKNSAEDGKSAATSKATEEPKSAGESESKGAGGSKADPDTKSGAGAKPVKKGE